MNTKVINLKKLLPIVAIVLMSLVAAAFLFGMTSADRVSQSDAGVYVQASAETADTPVTPETSDSTDNSNPTGSKAIAAGIAIGLAAAAGAIGMGIAIAKSNEAISRQPEADGKIRSTLMLGLILIETAIIYALVIAILIIFAL